MAVEGMTVDVRELWALACSSPRSRRGEHRPIATGVHWTWAAGENWTPFRVDPLEEYAGEAAGDTSPDLVTVEEWPYDKPMGRWTHFRHKVTTAEEIRSAEAGHIVRHDPARVLRDVEAKRRILAAYVDDDRVRFGAFESCSDSCPAQVLDEVVKLLALPYVEHPDYQEAWRP